MSIVKLKKVMISDLILKSDLKIGFFFGSLNSLELMKDVSQVSLENSTLNFKKNHELYFNLSFDLLKEQTENKTLPIELDLLLKESSTTIAGALYNIIDDKKNELKAMEKSIEDSFKLYKYRFPLSLFFRKKKRDLLNISNNLTQYKKNLENLNVDEVLEHYKTESHYLEKEIFYPEINKKIGDIVYVVYSKISMPKKDFSETAFGVQKLELTKINYFCQGSFNEDDNDYIYTNLTLNVRPLKECDYDIKKLSFSIDKTNKNLVLDNATSNYKIFLNKEDALEYVEFLKNCISKNMKEIDDSIYSF